ncbi:MAG: TIGR04282 family arsenosugar biosynthesis glycosyltransferase [Caldimonas sp.]
MTTSCAVIVFAKAPVAGTVKTRLAGALGAAGAARLAARMLEATTACALEAAVGPVEVCCAPDRSHPAFTALASASTVVLTEQGEGDLGQRMHRALERALASVPFAIVIGTDAPQLDAGYLREAAAALGHHDAVIGPAVDGGYALIGLRRSAPPTLFDGIDWSTSRVLAQTRERLGRLGLRWAEFAPLHDIDEPADLRHLPAGWAPLPLQE